MPQKKQFDQTQLLTHINHPRHPTNIRSYKQRKISQLYGNKTSYKVKPFPFLLNNYSHAYVKIFTFYCVEHCLSFPMLQTEIKTDLRLKSYDQNNFPKISNNKGWHGPCKPTRPVQLPKTKSHSKIRGPARPTVQPCTARVRRPGTSSLFHWWPARPVQTCTARVGVSSNFSKISFFR